MDYEAAPHGPAIVESLNAAADIIDQLERGLFAEDLAPGLEDVVLRNVQHGLERIARQLQELQ